MFGDFRKQLMPCTHPRLNNTLLGLLVWWTILLTTARPETPAVPQAATQQPSITPLAESVGKANTPKTPTDLQAIEAKVKQVIARGLPAVVAVRIGNSQGSGVIVNTEGYVLCAGHVVGTPGQEAVVIFADGKRSKAKTLGVHRTADAGLLKLSNPGPWPNVEMGHSAGLEKGSWCVALGHPLGYQVGRPPVVRVGRLLRAEATTLQTDCPLVAGDSGGPLLDFSGKVIGIHSRIAGSAVMNFHVPIDIFRTGWERLVKGEAWEDPLPKRDSDEVKAAFRSVVTPSMACVVRVKCEGKDAVLGTIIGPDGWILTKASELTGRITCRLHDGRELESRVVGIHPQFDLAMLKLDLTGLPVISWSRRPIAVGQWVASVGADDSLPLAVGVVSLAPRKIAPASGMLGITISEADGGGRIMRVVPNSPAQKAGLQPDDVITYLNGRSTPNQTEVIAAIKHHSPGDTVKLQVKRGEVVMEMSATLAVLGTPAVRRRDLQNRSAGGISARNDDFPLVLQHDTVLRSADCGGPLVDLTGKVIGVNIYVSGSTEIYSVPTEVLLPLMYDLMSGKLAPPSRNQRSL